MKLRSLGLAAATLTTSVSLLAGCSHMPNRVATAMAGGWSAVTFSTPSEQRAVILDYGTTANLTKLASAGVDIWSVDRKAHRAKVQIDKAQSDNIENAAAQFGIGTLGGIVLLIGGLVYIAGSAPGRRPEEDENPFLKPPADGSKPDPKGPAAPPKP